MSIELGFAFLTLGAIFVPSYFLILDAIEDRKNRLAKEKRKKKKLKLQS